MRLEDYTPDAICQAMNLAGFIEPSWTQADQPTLRVVLKPAFHPELCITVAPTADAAKLSVVALAEQLWAQQGVVYLSSDREETQVSGNNFEKVIGLFQKAHDSLEPDRRYAFCDGMLSDACLVSRAATLRLSVHVSAHQANAALIARLIDLAWHNCKRPRVRNAMAQAASYMEIKYPLQESASESPATRLAIMGAPEDRRDYLDMLKRQKKDGD